MLCAAADERLRPPVMMFRIRCQASDGSLDDIGVRG